MPFESLGAVSYSPSIISMTVSVAVCEIFSFKEWCDLKNRVRARPRSLEMAPDPAGGAYSAPPDCLAGFRGLLLRGGEGMEGRKGRERGGDGGEGSTPKVLLK